MINHFWLAVLNQDRDSIKKFFQDDAYVNWHCTNERFTVDEFIRANCEYPGKWNGEIERVETVGDVTITVDRLFTKMYEDWSSGHITEYNFKILSQKY